MADDLSFKAVCQLLKQQEPKLIEKVDDILGPVIILSGLAGAAAGFPGSIGVAGSLLGPKNALTSAGKSLLKHLTAKKYGGPLERIQRMQAAYSLLPFTSFFDTVDEAFPAIRKAFGLSPNEKFLIVSGGLLKNDELRESAASAVASSFLTDDASGILGQEISLPHPADTSETSEVQPQRIHQELIRGYHRFIQGLAEWEGADDKVRKKIDDQVAKLPALALASYRAQYIDLARQFPEFFVWATLQEHEEHRAYLQKLSVYWKRHVDLSQASQERIDLGFKQLGDAIGALPSALASMQPLAVINELLRRYASYIEQPVVDEEFPAAPGTEPLRFPKRSEAFVPQAFRVLRAFGRERLEDESTWRNLAKRHDLGAFLLSYLSSPYSFRYPLLILGDPGSGKSLLTHMLAARLISPEFTPIRAELRALDSDEIAQQIEEQVAKDTNGQRVSWPSLNTQLRQSPALVILDGYDELLQASGKVYAGYLQSVRQFQDTERTLGRPPVRAIVTSRITLIDKARIPVGSTIIRLEPFDRPRREQWIAVWNRTNAEFFRRSRPEVLPFEVPEDDKQMVELAEQPLLLLMLAIYDSHANELRRSRGLDRTRLYEDLLRRFIDRELSKDAGFGELSEADQDEQIKAELERLGVVAISMFNRRSLLIRSEELEIDLKFFDCQRDQELPDGRVLRQSEMLLGSFFFVHESRSTSKGVSASESEIESAFQFLHNTFGEFLAARFLVESVVGQANKVDHLRRSPVLSAELNRKLVDPAGLDKGWIASLIYTPIFSRPVVLEMVREWLPHRLAGTIDIDSFRLAFDIIVNAELRRLLERGQIPSLVNNSGISSFRALPILGHLAIYTNNLIVLRATVPDGEFIFNESEYAMHEDGARPWDRLAYMWRGWFALDTLQGLTAILDTVRSEEVVHLKARERFTSPSPRDRFEMIREVGRALGDGALSGLAAIEALDPTKVAEEELDRIWRDLRRERIDFRVELMTLRLRSWQRNLKRTEDLSQLFEQCVSLAEESGRERPVKTVEMVRASFECARMVGWYPATGRILRVITDWVDERPQEISLEVIELLLDFGEIGLGTRFIEDTYEGLRRWQSQVSDPRYASALLRAAVRVGDWVLARHLAEILLSLGQSPGSSIPRKGRPLRRGRLTLGLGLDPAVALALMQVAAKNLKREGWSRIFEEVWASHLRPEVVAMWHPYVILEAVQLLPMDAAFARDWLENFGKLIIDQRSEAGSYWRGSYALLILCIADLASKMESPIANWMAGRLVRINPHSLLETGHGVEVLPSRGRRQSSRLWGLFWAELAVRVVRLARDQEQSKIWFSDLIRRVLLPAFGGPDRLPAGVVVELVQSCQHLRMRPEELGLSSEILSRHLGKLIEPLQSVLVNNIAGSKRKRREGAQAKTVSEGTE